jgi:hypothetical protein
LGAGDGVVSPSYGAGYARLIPNARFEVIGEAGHHPGLERPRAFFRVRARVPPVIFIVRPRGERPTDPGTRVVPGR